MEVEIYTNNSADNVVTKNTTLIATLSGTLRKECSMLDPVILVEGMINATAAICNYAKIASFGRYYFVKNITLKGNLWELQLHVDVLSSFQTELKKLDAVIARQEKRYNLYLRDGYFKTYSNSHVSIQPFPASFDTQQFIFAVSGS